MEGWDGLGDNLLQRFFWLNFSTLFDVFFLLNFSTCLFLFFLLNWHLLFLFLFLFDELKLCSFFWKDVWFSNGTVF